MAGLTPRKSTSTQTRRRTALVPPAWTKFMKEAAGRRKAKKISLDKVAEILDVHPRTVAAWETGKDQSPHAWDLVRYLQAIGEELDLCALPEENP